MVVPLFDLSSVHAEIGAELEEALNSVLRSQRFVGGAAVESFEERWARYCGTSHAVGVGNGTDALELTLVALGIGPGDEVVVPANTFVATVEAVVSAGATPVFADVEEDTLLISGRTLHAALSPRTVAVMAVHLYGNPVDMDDVGAVAAGTGLAVIEDAAQAHGARWNGRVVGSIGRAGCFSFYPSKNLGALGDGGAVVTNDAALADRVRRLADHGRVPGRSGEHSVPGRNSRLDALQAAALAVKLSRLDTWNSARRRWAATYRDRLEGIGVVQVAGHERGRGVHHLQVVRVPNRGLVRSILARQGIETGIHYSPPCHRQAAFSDYATESLKVVESAATEVLSLPMYPHLTSEQVDLVVRALDQALRETKTGRPA